MLDITMWMSVMFVGIFLFFLGCKRFKKKKPGENIFGIIIDVLIGGFSVPFILLFFGLLCIGASISALIFR